MLKKAMGLILPKYNEPSVCEACGEMFACGATLSGCWCTEIKLSEAVRTDLRIRYENCLCRACLENLAEGETINGEEKEPLSARASHRS